MFVPPVILDTNIFVGAGFNAESNARRITEAVEHGDLLLVWSDATRAESLKVVSSIPPLPDGVFEAMFTDAGHYDGPTRPDRFQQVPDETDRKFAALAEATGVVLVSNDDDLLANRKQTGVTIHTSSEYVERAGIFL